MRLVALIVWLALVADAAVAEPPKAGATVEELFTQFGMFGRWAGDCAKPAAAVNPHVLVTQPSPGLVQEDHDFGPEFAGNRYSVLTATALSPSRLEVDVIFQPGAANEERQKLVLLIRDGTRRTMFNQTEGGPARVREGIVVRTSSRTPSLRKCG